METFLSLLVIACGLFSIVCVYKDFDWFMNHRKARFMVGAIGRKGAHIFYGVLGFVVCCGGTALLVTGAPMM